MRTNYILGPQLPDWLLDQAHFQLEHLFLDILLCCILELDFLFLLLKDFSVEKMHFEELFDLLDPIEIYFVFYSFHLDLRLHYYSSLNLYLGHQSVLLYLMHVRLHLRNSYQHHAFSFIWYRII